MFNRLITFLKKIDWVLFVLAVLLVVIGLVIQYSLILNSATHDFNPFYKQLFAFLIGLALFFIFSYFDFRWFKTYAYPIIVLSFLMLLGLLFFGESLRGTRGWYVLGPVSFQPIELVKIFLVVFLAKFFSSCIRKSHGPRFYDIILSCLTMAVLFTLVILQPDLGSALLLFGTWFLVLLIVAKKKIHVLFFVILIAIISVSAWLFLLKDYQKERVLTFLDSSRDPLGAGYQVNQSIIAVGSGQLLGRGLGLGPQSQLRFLPDSSTDFIFSVIAEEFGFIGVAIVLGLFALLFWRITSYTKIAYSEFSMLLVVGFLGLIFLQTFINIGMNIGLLPVTGVPLPFTSYGNSSLLAFFIGLGILESIRVHRVRPREL